MGRWVGGLEGNWRAGASPLLLLSSCLLIPLPAPLPRQTGCWRHDASHKPGLTSLLVPPPPLASHLLLRAFFHSGKLYPVSGNLTAKMFHVLPISGNCLIREDANVLKIFENIFRSYQCTNKPDTKSYQEVRLNPCLVMPLSRRATLNAKFQKSKLFKTMVHLRSVQLKGFEADCSVVLCSWCRLNWTCAFVFVFFCLCAWSMYLCILTPRKCDYCCSSSVSEKPDLHTNG